MKINGFYIGYPRRDNFIVERTVNFSKPLEFTQEQKDALEDSQDIRLIITQTGALHR